MKRKFANNFRSISAHVFGLHLFLKKKTNSIVFIPFHIEVFQCHHFCGILASMLRIKSLQTVSIKVCLTLEYSARFLREIWKSRESNWKINKIQKENETTEKKISEKRRQLYSNNRDLNFDDRSFPHFSCSKFNNSEKIFEFVFFVFYVVLKI